MAYRNAGESPESRSLSDGTSHSAVCWLALQACSSAGFSAATSSVAGIVRAASAQDSAAPRPNLLPQPRSAWGRRWQTTCETNLQRLQGIQKCIAHPYLLATPAARVSLMPSISRGLIWLHELPHWCGEQHLSSCDAAAAPSTAGTPTCGPSWLEWLSSSIFPSPSAAEVDFCWLCR